MQSGETNFTDIMRCLLTWKNCLFSDMPGIAGYKTTYEVQKAGSGASVVKNAKVTVHATGVVKETGKKFWSTKDPGQQPFSYNAGVGQVIITGHRGLFRMQIGKKRSWVLFFTFFWDFKAHETYHLSGDHWVGPRFVGNADWGREEVDDPSGRRLWCSGVPSLGNSSKWHSWVHPRGVEDWVMFKLLEQAIFRKSPQWHDASFGEISIKGLTPIQKFIGLHLIVDTGVSTSNRRPTFIKFWQSPF